MRMWMVDPKLLCNNHLLGEHYECHKFVYSLNKNKSVKGYIENNLLEVHNLRKRHNELVKEMINRGMNHKSPLVEFKEVKKGSINIVSNLKELSERCEKCRIRINSV